jgi:hypothetical protein
MKTLSAEDIGYDVKGHQEVLRDVVTTRVENILCFIYISNQGSLESIVKKTLGDIGKAPKKSNERCWKGHHEC